MTSPTWTATVVFDADGTKTLRLTGARVSTQIFAEPDDARERRGVAVAFNEEGEEVEVLQVSKVHYIHKRRVPADTATDLEDR